MHGIRRALPSTMLACTAAVVVACTAGTPTSSATHAAKTPVPASSATAALAPGASRTQAISAYTSMWHAYAAAAKTADYQPGTVDHYAAGDALNVLLRALYDNHQHDIVLRGEPALNPKVTALNLSADPASVGITDCADDSGWRQYTTSGRPAAGTPAGKHRIYAQMRMFGTAWKATSLVVKKAGTC